MDFLNAGLVESDDNKVTIPSMSDPKDLLAPTYSTKIEGTVESDDNKVTIPSDMSNPTIEATKVEETPSGVITTNVEGTIQPDDVAATTVPQMELVSVGGQVQSLDKNVNKD